MREYLQFYINGEWTDPAQRQTMDVIDPATEQVCGTVNCPFGGYKKSGNGREWGEFGFDEYLETKGILGYAPESR